MGEHRLLRAMLDRILALDPAARFRDAAEARTMLRDGPGPVGLVVTDSRVPASDLFKPISSPIDMVGGCLGTLVLVWAGEQDQTKPR